MTRIRAALDKLSNNRLAGLALCFALLVAVLNIPFQLRDFALPIIPRAQLAYAPEIQTRTTLGDIPYQTLRDAHTLLPADASIVLVTDGTDVRHREYMTFHRALYYLTPRSVWWFTPAPGDGTWESRWWHSAPLTESAISEFAQSKNADFVLLFDNQDLSPSGQTLVETDGAKLVQIRDNVTGTPPNQTIDFAPADYAWRVLAALALFFLNGTLIVQMLSRTGFNPGRIELFALSWCLGVGLVTFYLLALLALGLTLTNSIWIGVGVAVISAAFSDSIVYCLKNYKDGLSLRGAGYAMRCTPSPQSVPAKKIDLSIKTPVRTLPTLRWQTILLLAILVLQTLYVALIALGQPLTFWDSWVTWSMKARAIFLEQTISAAILTDASRAVTHLDYPLLLPLAQAGLFQILGAPDDRFVGWISLAFFLALIALVYSAARTFGATPTRALLAAAVVSAIPTVALLAAQNYADVPLAVYGILTVTYLLRWIERGERGALVVSMLGAVFLAWTKRRRFCSRPLHFDCRPPSLSTQFTRPSRRVRCALTSSLVAISWTLWLTAQGTTNTDLLPVSVLTLNQNLYRMPTILLYFSSTLVNMQWAFVWVCAAGPTIIPPRTPRGHLLRPLSRLCAGLYCILEPDLYLFRLCTLHRTSRQFGLSPYLPRHSVHRGLARPSAGAAIPCNRLERPF